MKTAVTWGALVAMAALVGDARVARADDGGVDDAGPAVDAGSDAGDAGDAGEGDGGGLGQIGATCTAAAQCASGFCADGYCCNSACTGQCEACGGASTAGTCVPVIGSPPADKSPCAAASLTNPCSQTVCDGITPSTCAGFVGSTVTCGVATCVNNEATSSGLCNGQGTCATPAAVECGAYGCGATACNTTCASSADCADGFVCDTTSGVGVCGQLATGECGPDGHTVTEPDGTTTDCTPYVCNQNGLCLLECASNADCVSGDVCNASSDCVPTAGSETSSSSGSSGGGCAAAPSSEGSTVLWIGLGLVGIVAGRKRRRG